MPTYMIKIGKRKFKVRSKEKQCRLRVTYTPEMIIKAEKEEIKQEDGTIKIKYNEPICAICEESISVGSKTILLVCKHVFHEQCITKWRFGQHNNTCPNCRQVTHYRHGLVS
jgi:Ring finger domain